jgi:D-beta-D-heptose 7-phosphate kinase/D-beta-D-heptose 1-phosphate adenosyltransferase
MGNDDEPERAMTAQAIRDLVGRFGQLRVLVVGDPILDEYVTGDCTRLSPEAPIPVLRVRATRSVLGGAANTAANVAALGGQAVLVGVVGHDDAGQRLADLVLERGVTNALVADSRPTSRKVRALGGQQQLLRLDYEDDVPAAAEVVATALDRVRQQIGNADVLVVSDYAKGLVGPAFCQEVLRLARQAGVPVVIDPRPQNAGCYDGCDYLTPNWKEAQALLGDLDGPPTAAAVGDVGRRLAGRFGANVLLTLGAHGIRFFGRDGSQTFDEPARAREVFDVSGAGDTVVAAFALALAAGAGIQESLRLANLAAGVVVAKVGTATVSPGELTAEAEGDERVVDRATLAHQVRELRSAGRRVVAVMGAFETIRPGNLQLLRDARRRGDVLVVGLRAGTIDAQARARVLIGLRDVDFVHVIDDPDWFLEVLRPDEHFDESTPADTGSTVR